MRLLAAVTTVALAACTTGEKIHSLQTGMSREQVIATLGNPDGDRSDGRSEQLIYASRLMSGWSYDKADYQVTLVDGRVANYGPARVMTAPPPQGIVVLHN